MAWTYETLKAAILSYIETDEENLVANMPIIVQQAEDRILKAVQLPDFRKNVTGTVTVSDPYLIMPTDFLSPYSMAVDNTGYEFLIFKEVSFVRQAYPDVTVTSVPKYYAIFSSEYFLVGPTPDQNYDIELHYFYKPESIVTAGTSWLGDNAESTLLYGCLVEAYTYTKGEADMVKTVNTRYTEALDKLKLLGEGRNATDSYRNG
jgi:hypothetical protein